MDIYYSTISGNRRYWIEFTSNRRVVYSFRYTPPPHQLQHIMDQMSFDLEYFVLRFLVYFPWLWNDYLLEIGRYPDLSHKGWILTAQPPPGMLCIESLSPSLFRFLPDKPVSQLLVSPIHARLGGKTSLKKKSNHCSPTSTWHLSGQPNCHGCWCVVGAEEALILDTWDLYHQLDGIDLSNGHPMIQLFYSLILHLGGAFRGREIYFVTYIASYPCYAAAGMVGLVQVATRYKSFLPRVYLLGFSTVIWNESTGSHSTFQSSKGSTVNTWRDLVRWYAFRANW
jgi:hypothetical protein